MIEQALDGLLIVDQAGAIVLANPTAIGMFGAPDQAALLGKQIGDMISPDQAERYTSALACVLDGSSLEARIEIVLEHAPGRCRRIEMQIGLLSWNDQPAAQIIARTSAVYAHDDALEAERRYMARELHDGLAQMVTSAHQHLQAYAAHHRPRTQLGRAELDRILDLARSSVIEVRRVIAGLRPSALEDFGLAAALESLVEMLRGDGWDVSYQETLGTERLTPSIEAAVYRIAQEALTNARKHGQTNRVAVRLDRGEHGLQLAVQDWGRGFEPAQVPGDSGQGERIGLHGMHERVTLLGGRWNVESSPGAGVLISVEIPLASALERV